MKAGDSGLIPLEVIKAKAALHVSDWDLEDLVDSMPPTPLDHVSHLCTHPTCSAQK